MSKLIAFRCPDNLIEVINTRTAETGKDKTSVLLEMLQGFTSISIMNRANLPESAAIYLVWTGNKLLYVGQTANLKSRFLTHHRISQFINADAQISWFDSGNNNRLPIEESLIELLEPELNGTEYQPRGDYQAVSVYLPPHLADKVRDYANSHSLTRKNKNGSVKPALATAITQIISEYFDDCTESKNDDSPKEVIDSVLDRLDRLESITSHLNSEAFNEASSTVPVDDTVRPMSTSAKAHYPKIPNTVPTNTKPIVLPDGKVANYLRYQSFRAYLGLNPSKKKCDRRNADELIERARATGKGKWVVDLPKTKFYFVGI